MNQTELFYSAFREACRSMSMIAQPRQDHNLQSMARIKSRINMIRSEGLTDDQIRAKIEKLKGRIGFNIAWGLSRKRIKADIARLNKFQQYLKLKSA